MVIYQEDDMGSPSSIPVISSTSKEWSESGLNMNLSKAFDNASSFDEGNIDIELDAAVQRALGDSHDDTASQSTDSGVYTHEEMSVYSEANTETSSKSAIQLRLERRKKAAAPTREQIKAKHDAANKRRNKSLSFVAQRASEHFKEAKKTAHHLESKNNSKTESLLQKLERKMNEANDRKEEQLKTIAARYQNKYDRAYRTKSMHEKDTREIQRKLDNKLSLAAERKEQSLREITSKLHGKSELISYSLSQFDIDAEDNKDKLKKKLSLAAERKEQRLESMSSNISNKLQDNFDRVQNMKRMQDDESRVIQDKIDRKMTFASLRKEKHLQSLSFRSIGNLDRVLSARSLFDDETEEKREKHEKKMAFANMRKEEHLQNVIAKNQNKLDKASENRDMQTKAVQEKVEKKHQLAAERKEQHIQDITTKMHDKLEKVSSTKKLLEIQNKKQVKAEKRKLEEKLNKAMERRDIESQSMASIQDKIDRAADNRELQAKAIEEKVERKLQEASRRLEQIDFESQSMATVQDKIERAADNRELQTKAIEEKLETKLQLASERKEQHIQEVTTKMQDRLDKVSNTKKLLEWRSEQLANVVKMKHEAKHNKALERRDLESQSMASVQDKIERAADNRELQTKAIEEKVDAKLQMAIERKEKLMQNISSKQRDKMNKIEESKIQHEEETKAVQQKLDAKQTSAAERKEQIAMEIAAKNQAKMQKAAENRDSHARAVQEKVETKLNQAAERKEQHVQSIVSKANEKSEKISNLKLQQEEDVKANQEKLDQKLSQASERKDQLLQGIIGKNEEKLNKATEAREQQARSVQEKVEKKLTAAVERKEQLDQEIVNKFNEKKEKIASHKSQQEDETRSIQEKVEKKLILATERKDQHIKSIVDKSKVKMEKVNLAESKRPQTPRQEMLTQEKLEKKLAEAAERKELRLQNITNRLQEKMEKASSARNVLDERHEAETQAIQEKNEMKLSLAIERKDSHMKDKTSKMKSKMDRIAENKKTTQMRLRELGQKFAQKMAEANARKNDTNIDRKISVMPKKQHDEDLEVRREKLEEKLFLAAERKQDQLEAKVARAAAYYSNTLQKGLEAMKKREDTPLSETSISGEESFMCEEINPLTSINEDEEYDQDSVSIAPSIASSIAPSIASSSSTKSNVQIRLENWKRKSATKESLDAKLNAASSRRKLAILDVQEKAGLGTKFDKASKRMQSTHDTLKNLEEKFAQKMFAATKRKEEIMNKTVEKAAVSGQKRAEDAEKVSAMQQKLEQKLLSAIQRKEKIIASRARKAAGNVSLSSERGQSALKQKEQMIERVKSQSQNKLESAKSRKKLLKQLEKEKKEVNLMRRVMTQKMQQEGTESGSVSSLQEKLDRKLQLANERKKNYLAAKASKAREHVSSTSERGLEVLKQRESSGRQLKIESVDKLESAAKRKAQIGEQDQKKKEQRQKRREMALEVARQKKKEQEMIAKWEARTAPSKERLPVVDELQDETHDEEDPVTEEDVAVEEEVYQRRQEVFDLQAANTDEAVDFLDLPQTKSEETYDSKKLAARQMLANEIRLANEAKTRELSRISEERREVERRERARREIARPADLARGDRAMSVGTIGSIDSNDLCSFDEEEISISGLSTVREEESKIDRRKAQAALALAELDIKLSEIQIMQAILLAEEASLKGDSEFRTSEKSITDLNNVKVTMNVSTDENGVKKVKKQAQNFFNYTLKSAKEAQQRAGTTIGQMRRKGIFKRT